MRSKLPRCSILLLIVTSFTIGIRCFSQNFNFKNYSLDDGLSQSEINCIYEDSRGYLWMGTSGGGLDRFDGNTFKVYEQKDGLCSQIISAVTEDLSGNLWIGSEQGALCRFNGKEFSNVEDDDRRSLKGKIIFISVDDNKDIIIGKSNGLYIYNGKKPEPLLVTGDTTKGYKINCFKKDSRNITWIGTSRGLLVLKNKSLLKIIDPDLDQNINVTALTEDVNGNIWAVKDRKEFYRITIVGPSHYQVKAAKIDTIALPPNTDISSVHFDKRNQLWVASANKGIIKPAGSTYTAFDLQSGLSIENIKNIFEDSSGNLWFGTSGGGLIRFSNQAFAYFDNLPGFNAPDIFSINADKNNNIWIGTQLHGVYKFDGKTAIKINDPFGDEEMRCIHTDSKGNIWFGSNSGIQQYDGKTFRQFMPDTGLKKIRTFFEDSKGNMWIGTLGNGVYVYTADRALHRMRDAHDNAYSFAEDGRNNIWIGTGDGVYVYRNERLVKHYMTTDGLCNSYAGSMVKDKYGNIWVGTDNCVAKFDGSKFVSYGINEGLTSGTVYLINADSLGNVWVGTNKGLDKITLNASGGIESIHNYGKAEGFKGIECNSRATCIDHTGCLWFGTIKGAIKFNPHEDINATHEVPITHISDIKLFYENVDWKKYSDSISTWFNVPASAVIPYDKNQITIEFSAISKTFPDNIKYSFMLDGFDKSWSPPDDNHSASYSNLPAGTYTFKVRSVNKSGIWSAADATFTFVVRAPFWRSWWFILLILAGIGAVIYMYNWYRKRKHERYAERLEKIIRGRTTEIIRQRDEKEVLLKEVHHRVKNNLQIINSLINIQSDYVNDPRSQELFKEIRNRIRTISLVHEKLYKSDDYVNINVKEYINMLVENLIDTYSFEKNINLNIDLQVEHFNLNTIIPLGLLMNEIISNSFKYAFNDRNEGTIEIRLQRLNSTDYVLLIGDDGKGFENDPFNGESATLGLELVKILAEQLNGKISKLAGKGTYYRLEFKPLKD